MSRTAAVSGLERHPIPKKAPSLKYVVLSDTLNKSEPGCANISDKKTNNFNEPTLNGSICPERLRTVITACSKKKNQSVPLELGDANSTGLYLHSSKEQNLKGSPDQMLV